MVESNGSDTAPDMAVFRGYRATEKPRCPYCGGFLRETDTHTVCPNCNRAVRRFLKKAGQTTTAGEKIGQRSI